MQVLDEILMQEMRDAKRCNLCGKMRYYGCPMHPHHIARRGTGGGSRVDVRFNLLALHWDCHDSTENGHVPILVQWACVAAREKKTIEEVSSFVNALINAPKEAIFRDGKLHLPSWARPGVLGNAIDGSALGERGAGGTHTDTRLSG